MPLEAENEIENNTDMKLLVRFLDYVKTSGGDLTDKTIEGFMTIDDVMRDKIHKSEFIHHEVERVNKALVNENKFSSLNANDKADLINNMKEIINVMENPLDNKISDLKYYDKDERENPEKVAMKSILIRLNEIEQVSNPVISKKIIARIKEANQPFMAINNISDFIEEGEIQLLIDEVAVKFEDALKSLIIDVENDPNSNGTGMRMAKMYINEIMSGRYFPAPNITSFPNDDNKYDQLIFTRTDIKSMCSHHHQPVTGVCYIACLPGDKVIGLSKYSRVAQHFARRGTLQEELTVLIADKIVGITNSKAVGVHIRARHGCCENRGIMSSNSNTQTTVVRGEMKTDIFLKEEFMNNIHFAEMNNRGN